MKKFIVIVTLILITVFSTASFFIYFGYLSSYQSAYQSFIKNNKLNLVTEIVSINPSQLYINSKQIIWEDDNKEIFIDGVLYDIILMASNKDKVELTILSDTKEQDIKKQFASSYDVTSTKSANNPLKLLKQFLSLKFLNTTAEFLSKTPAKICNIVFSNYTFSIKSINILPEILPPIFMA